MKRIIAALFGILALLSGCENNDIKNIELTDGTYTGIFYRTSPTADRVASNVTLTFNDGIFQGASDSTKYPAICKGTYVVSGQQVEFTNQCPWTADFDWTLILSGTFKITGEDGQIVMTRPHNTNTFDTYKLTKQ